MPPIAGQARSLIMRTALIAALPVTGDRRASAPGGLSPLDAPGSRLITVRAAHTASLDTAPATQASQQLDARLHEQQRERVAASLLLRGQREKPAHRRWA
jgi:hypothetical protein